MLLLNYAELRLLIEVVFIAKGLFLAQFKCASFSLLDRGDLPFYTRSQTNITLATAEKVKNLSVRQLLNHTRNKSGEYFDIVGLVHEFSWTRRLKS